MSLAATTRRAIGAALGAFLAGAIAFAPARGLAQAVAQSEVQSAPAAAPRAAGSGPALWVVRDADSTIYLFGTVHVLRPTTAWGSDRVDAAFDSADQIWLEIANPNDQAAIVPLIQQHGIALDRPLSTLLSAEQFTALDAAARTVGLSGAQMDRFRPWFAALTLATAPLVKAGYSPTSGVELILTARAQAAGKSIHGFETLEQQVSLLAGLPEADQIAFLNATLDNFENATTQLDGLVEAWARGDVDAIERFAQEDMGDDSKVLHDTLLTRRNADWARQIKTMLDGSGTAFIAVGAAHLAGPDSVQAQLQALGVPVEPAP